MANFGFTTYYLPLENDNFSDHFQDAKGTKSPFDHDIELSAFKTSTPASTSTSSSSSSSSFQRHSLYSSVKRFWKRCFLYTFLGLISLLTWTAIFNPSYTNPPPFQQLDEKIFIAANIINSDLIQGAWGDLVIQLIDLLGPNNVFLSIYGGPTDALKNLESRIQCDYSLISEDISPVPYDSLHQITLPGSNNKQQRPKRTEYLSKVRNRALKPLDTLTTKFDKILFLNDIIFNPDDAARLLFSTNLINGKTDYRAACAVDFVNPFKFYDTFATRDFEGHSMGLPFFPWFANIGKAESRREVTNGKEAVRVKSCWGGMVAFEAKWFQRGNSSIRFRAETEQFWDASECCLINADLQSVAGSGGIYMNPYVRVAYDTKTFKWLGFTRRFEKLYSLIHDILNRMVHLPHKNPRYQEVAGQIIVEETYNHDSGYYHTTNRIAGNAGYCGSKMLQVMKDNPKKGEKMWESVNVVGY